ECGALLPYVEEGCLKPGEDAGDLAEDDVPDASRVRVPFSLDVELGDDAVFDERDARFSDVTTDDDDVLGHGGKKHPPPPPPRPPGPGRPAPPPRCERGAVGRLSGSKPAKCIARDFRAN